MLSVTDSWKKIYPGASVGIMVLSNVSNPDRSELLENHKRECEAAIKSKFPSRETINDDARIKAYRDYYKSFGKTYHVAMQLESVALKDKKIPSVAGLVEAMFVAELKNALLTAGHDYDTLNGSLVLDVGAGTEPYTLMNGKEQVMKPGDMMIADQEGIISSILHGPDLRTRITPQTKKAVFMIYAPNGISQQAVMDHLSDIHSYTKLFSPDAEIELQKIFA